MPAVAWTLDDETEVSATLLITTALSGEAPTGTRPEPIERHTASVPPAPLSATATVPAL